ncbi:MAG: AbrB/MazE/SpoVT family DNA-binding domain-containing protein [Proteobacteria bacterium]|nr:AbrB/MazE/SpoVT family DNA-binding domain-containing protein [Pseudomonadota bacterium]
MAVGTITSKGQTTIPKSVRDRLALKAGDRLEFVVQDDGAVLMVPATVSLDELEGMLPRPSRTVTLDDMDRAIRERGGANSGDD